MAANISTGSNVPLPSTPDLERQPLLNSNPNGATPYNTNGSAPNGSHHPRIPSTLGMGRRRPSDAELHERRRDKIRKCWRVGMLAVLFALLGFLFMCLFELYYG
jgi:hypothetical protein